MLALAGIVLAILHYAPWHGAAAGRPVAFHVAPTGSDEADGSAAQPFATLGRALAAMETGPIRTTRVGQGDYRMSAALRLSAVHSGVAFLAADAMLDGADAGLATLIELDGTRHVTLRGFALHPAPARHPGEAAILLRGGASNLVVGNRISGAQTGILLDGARRNHLVGNVIVGSGQSGIELKDGADDNMVVANEIDGVAALAQSGGGIFLHGGNRNAIAFNRVQNTAGVGISIANWDDTTVNVGNAIGWNLVRDTSTASQDSGAIYLLGRSHVDMRTPVVGNVIEGTGAGGDAHTIGIYLDDSTSGVRVLGNRVTNIGTHGLQVHGGDDNIVAGNLFDLGAGATSAVLFQAAPADTNPTNTMRGNVVTGNVVIASGVAQTAFTELEGGRPEISGNLYAGLGPNQVAADVSPVFAAAGDAVRQLGPDSDGPAASAGPAATMLGLSLRKLPPYVVRFWMRAMFGSAWAEGGTPIPFTPRP